MGKIRYTVRLYRVHDLDLITFVETHEFNIAKAIYSSLSAFSKGDHFVIEVPPRRVESMPDLKRVYQKPIYLDEEKDKKAIDILNKIEKGYRNNFLKNLLRQYLCTPLSEAFLVNEKDSDFFYDKFSIFKENKRTAKAGKIRSTDSQSQEIQDTKQLKGEKPDDVVEPIEAFKEEDFEQDSNDESDDIIGMFSELF